MSQTLKAVYRGGAFVPVEPCDLPEERNRIMEELVARMRDNPIPADAPRFTREGLHERR